MALCLYLSLSNRFLKIQCREPGNLLPSDWPSCPRIPSMEQKQLCLEAAIDLKLPPMRELTQPPHSRCCISSGASPAGQREKQKVLRQKLLPLLRGDFSWLFIGIPVGLGPFDFHTFYVPFGEHWLPLMTWHGGISKTPPSHFLPGFVLGDHSPWVSHVLHVLFVGYWLPLVCTTFPKVPVEWVVLEERVSLQSLLPILKDSVPLNSGLIPYNTIHSTSRCHYLWRLRFKKAVQKCW